MGNLIEKQCQVTQTKVGELSNFNSLALHHWKESKSGNDVEEREREQSDYEINMEL